jgi:hypothetical protein
VKSSPPGCRYCWSRLDLICTDAHLHGCDNDTIRLCWVCHRVYDHDVIKTPELLAAETKFLRDPRARCRMTDLMLEWEEGLRSGRLKWDTSMHGDPGYRRQVALERDEIRQIHGLFGPLGWRSKLPREVPQTWIR